MIFIKRIVPFFLVMTILLKTFSLVTTVLLFKINRQFYAEVLCINKNRPELACKGKCVLMQKIQSQMETEQKRESDKFHNILERAFESIFFAKSPSSVEINSPQTHTAAIGTTLIDGYSLILAAKFFHPPLS